MLNRSESVYICIATQNLKIYKAVLRYYKRNNDNYQKIM